MLYLSFLFVPRHLFNLVVFFNENYTANLIF